MLWTATACASNASTLEAVPDVFSDRSASAERLFTAYSDIVVARDLDAMDAVLSEEFVIQRADGSWADERSFLEAVPNLRSFRMSDVTERRSDDIIVARFSATAELEIEGQAYPLTPAPMLVVFEWSGDQWRLVAQGNFNTPTTGGS